MSVQNLILNILTFNHPVEQKDFAFYTEKRNGSLPINQYEFPVNIEEVREFLKKLPEVSGEHDLHIWALGTTDAALTVHLTTCEQTDVSFITSIQHQLHERFGIEHATIQVEFGSKEDCGIKN